MFLRFKNLILALFLFLPVVTLGKTFEDSSQQRTSAGRIGLPSPQQPLWSIRAAVPLNATAEQISEVGDKMNWADACDKFADDTEFGKWGKLITKELKTNLYPSLMTGTSDLYSVCPAYSHLSADARRDVWVLILNAIAFYESSCDDDVTARGPNGPLAGLLQLHIGKESFYAPGCKKNDSKNPEGTFRCGLSMLNGQIERGEPLFSRKSYWDVLRPQARSQKYKKIIQALKSLPLCH